MLSTSQIKQDVFLSFRGENTRENFTSHLNEALCRSKIDTFIDYKLRRGDEISSALLEAIRGSKLSLIVFSKDYADSRWCLEELVEILECKRTIGQIVIPVFYQVDPCDVCNQTGEFGDSFAKLESRFKDRMKRWRDALAEAADMSSSNSDLYSTKSIRPESKLVEAIVKGVLKKLNLASSSVPRGLVGVSRVEKVLSLLCLWEPDVRMVGIWGMGGIGKTAIAGAVFHQISNNFEGSHFFNNISEIDKRGDLVIRRDELLSQILGDENYSDIGAPSLELNFTRDRLHRKRVLIVFDDVSDINQLETLIGGLEFGLGSRIIVTTRDKHVLQYYENTKIYKMEKLEEEESLQLFCQHAFGQNQPREDYIELSYKVVNYVQGLPLALFILGSSLHGKSTKHWESAINKLSKVIDPKILNVLKTSYNRLDYAEKNIFLNIASDFNGKDRNHTIKILESQYDSYVDSVVTDLIDKSLITISQDDKIYVHVLLQAMCWDIISHQKKMKY
ncbi:TMV resistance protein N-like [Carica papaya]|uniref:TMV resistance protein N-like n=1 Tax=Carica papaya TaxID=3649 RepID=UPI000B8C938F|nr:TMV resistance protein N-like [Carica papaya]